MMANLIGVVENTSRSVAQLALEMTNFKEEMLSFKDEMKDFKDEMLAFKDEMKAFKDEMLAFKDEMRDFKDEMLAFKDEMKAFKDEMLAFKDEMRDFKDEMLAFKDEMRAFKDEMRVFKSESEAWRAKSDESLEAFRREMREENRKLNKQLGEIANKQGRMVEDIVEPSMDRIFKELLGLPPEVVPEGAMRIKRPHPRTGLLREFDVIRAYGDYALVNETKSTLRPEDVDHVLATVQEVRDYFPEYRDRKWIACLATLNVDDSLVAHASRKGVVVLAVGDELMDIMNPPGFKFAEL
jgi:hypothetical protein